MKNRYRSIFLLILVSFLAGCSGGMAPSTPESTSVPALPPTHIPLPTNTQTALPTITIPPTDTPEPTATVTEVPTSTPMPEKLAGFSLPIPFAGYTVSAKDITAAPFGSITANDTNGILSFQIPAFSCVLIFTFGQPASDGYVVRFYQNPGDQTAWLETSLHLLPDNPHMAFVVLTQEYIINPPYWEVTYPFKVFAADGSQKWSGKLRFFRSFPGLCWEGSVPDPITLACPKADPKEREPHPDITMPPPHNN